jgi:hypothetical protein
MASLLRFQQIAEYLDLVTTDPKYATQDWRVEELFQREVSQKRVYDLVDHYLKSDSRPQFFNSLTIVLKPREGISEPYQSPMRDPAYKRSIGVGPIRISYDIEDSALRCPTPMTHGRLAWNRSQVYAVAIDGQHRLAAIKELGGDAALTSSLSVLFLVLDEKLAFQAPVGWSATTAMRSIFVDLNKRAERVSRARTLLLDDIDPRAQFVRRLFGPALGFAITEEKGPLGFPVGDKGEFDSRVPLALIDWHGETKSKIEQGPYLSSVLALDWIVKKTLDAKHPKKPAIPDLLSLSMDDENYYGRIKNVLSQWPLSWQGSGVDKHWQDCQDHGRPFFLNSKEIESLADEYEMTWGRPITRLLTGIGPYSKVVKKRLNADTLNPRFAQWYQAKADREAHEKSQVKIREYYRDRLEKIEGTLKNEVSIPQYREVVAEIDRLKKDSVFFYLVGQRALVFALRQLVEARNAVQLSEACGLGIHDYGDNLQDFYAHYLERAISSLWKKNGALYGKGYRVERDPSGETDELPNVFWAGTLVRRDQPSQVDFSEKAAERGARWFTLMAHLYWFARVHQVRTKEGFAPVLEAMEDQSGLEALPLGRELMEAIGGVIGTLSPPAYYVSPMSFLCGMLEGPTEEMAQTAAKERIDALMATMVLG